MARTIVEINAAARALDETNKPHPELPIVITLEEAALFVGELRGLRRERGRHVPDHKEMMKKLGSGKSSLHGHRIEVTI